MKRPNLFRYDNYRSYLKDWYAWMKGTHPAFSYRAFSQWAGFHSPNQLLLVITGQRNIALASLGRYFKALKFKQRERHYFELLVKFNQAKEMATKKEYFEELSRYWIRRGSELETNQYKYLANWYFVAIREMVHLKDFRESGLWISKKLAGLITPAEAKKAIGTLLELGLLARDEKNRLVQTHEYVTTGDESAAVAAFLYHEQMMKLAMESLRGRPSSQRNLTALTFTLQKEDYERIVDEISEFRKEIVATMQNRSVHESDDSLYQLNIHLFPIGEPGS